MKSRRQKPDKWIKPQTRRIWGEKSWQSPGHLSYRYVFIQSCTDKGAWVLIKFLIEKSCLTKTMRTGSLLTENLLTRITTRAFNLLLILPLLYQCCDQAWRTRSAQFSIRIFDQRSEFTRCSTSHMARNRNSRLKPQN